MNNWVYLILIAVLAILAVVMLYSRFAARSREKSFHHAPTRIMFSAETISVAPIEIQETSSTLATGEEPANTPLVNADAPDEREPQTPRVEKPKSLESDYLDELQEAAAGLALLMRSSPVGRVAPVVFAPDGPSEPAELESVSDPVNEAAPEEISESLVESEILSGIPSREEIEERVIPVREILGEQVFEIVDRIDLELEALENLVAGIESSLIYLGAPDPREDGDSATGEEESLVSEAA